MSLNNKQITIKKGTILFKQGDAGDCAYVVESGEVLIYLDSGDSEIIIAQINKGEIFGEMSLIDNLPRSASVRALSDTVLNVITKNQLIQRFQSADQIVQLLLKVMMNRVRKNNKSISQANSKEEVVDNGSGVFDAFENIKFENRLQEALNNNEFEMFYQPIVNSTDHKIVGAEALIRWNDPIRGYVSPDKFIDFLESSPLMISVGNWIFEKCFQDLKILKNTFGPDFSLSINVSGNQFTHEDFIMTLEQLSWKYRVDHKSIKLEVTERVMTNSTLALEILRSCKEKGFQLSIDDFGTGYSSLQYLSQMPIQYLKIDKSFVSQMSENGKVYAVVNSMIFMAEALGMEIIAEGVETVEESQLLTQLGAHLIQGWLYSKALPLHQFIKLSPFFNLVKKTA